MSRYMYIGPTRPLGLPLVHNQILAGELLEVYPQAASVVEAHPEIRKLIVPVGKLAQARAGLLKTGSVYGRANAAVKAAMAAAKKQ